jgi:hypothetical protein
MADVWTDCVRADWLLWILGRLKAGGLPEYARWCADRASAAAARAAARWPDSAPAARWAGCDAADAADEAAASTRAARAADAAEAAASASAAAVAAASASRWAADDDEHCEQVAEIKQRWGNPFLQSQR